MWYFENAGASEVWLASADWMGRNLFRRIEVAFPVRDPELAQRVVAEGLTAYLADNRDTWLLGSDGAWRKPPRRKGIPVRSAQTELIDAMQATEGDE